MKSAASSMVLAAFGTVVFMAPTAWAEDKAAVDEAALAGSSNATDVAAAAPAAEIELNNAAVNRAFVGGEVQAPEAPARPHRFGVYFGFRILNLKDPGYDPYSESDALAQNAIGISFTPWKSQRYGLHFLGEWNMGSSSAYARGVPTDLLVNRLALGVEGRWVPSSRFYLYARLVPSLVHIGGEIDDWALGAKLQSSAWTFAMDTSAGAALRLGTAGKAPKRTVSFWLMMDWGYAFARQAPMTFSPEPDDDDPRKFGSVNLPGLRLGGFVTRGSVGLTF